MMANYLTYVNLLTLDKDREKELIVSAVINMNPMFIQAVVKQPDGTTYIKFKTGEDYRLAILFEDFIKFLEGIADIDKSFKEDFDAYLKNNYGNTN